MKAPDKIYMPNELLSEEWQRHIEGEDTTYIRKDAMLEWARENQYKSLTIVADNLWQEVIDKINEL